MTSSRDKILEKIAIARNMRSSFRTVEIDGEKEIYKPILPDALTCFKNELEAVSGQCILCDDEQDLYAKISKLVSERSFPYLFCRDENLISKLKLHSIPYSDNQQDFEEMQAGITTCEFLVARTGSVMVSSSSPSGRQMHVFPPVHIVVAQVSQLVNYLDDALIAIRRKYGDDLPSAITTITGPSRTADIEKTLVLGAHGAKEMVVFINLDKRQKE